MNYAELNQKYNEHVKRNNEWLESLYYGAHKLGSAIGGFLQQPEDWEHEGKGGPYIEVIAFPKPGRMNRPGFEGGSNI